MDYRKEMQICIDYIEVNIKEDILAEELADRIGFSQKHFYRLFKTSVGMPVMEYIRRRKLAHAIYDLMLGRRVLDIAVEYGFDTHNGFAKAFKKYYGSSPQNYKSHAVCILPRPVNLLNQSNNYKIFGGIIMEPKIINKPAFKIAGYAIKTDAAKSTKDCPALWDVHNIEDWEEKLYKLLQPEKHGEYGVCIENNMERGEFVYLIGIEVDDFTKTTNDMYKAEIPNAEYAVFTTSPVTDAEFSKNIQSTWHYILEEWVPNSGYVWDECKPDFEFYDERCHGETNKMMEIYVPVMKK